MLTIAENTERISLDKDKIKESHSNDRNISQIENYAHTHTLKHSEIDLENSLEKE